MHRIMSHDMHEIPLTYRGFEGVRTERKVGPPKTPQTSGVWGHGPPQNFSNLGSQKCHYLRFPRDIFSK